MKIENILLILVQRELERHITQHQHHTVVKKHPVLKNLLSFKNLEINLESNEILNNVNK